MNEPDFKELASTWFSQLRDKICVEFEKIEKEFSAHNNFKFTKKSWQRDGGGGGVMSVMKGEVFEKVGVNISTVFGEFTPEFAKQITGAEQNPNFWASGISLVAHMNSPFIPAVHMNTRYIVTTKNWFGGGADLTPTFIDEQDRDEFHNAFKEACDQFDPLYYEKYKKACDEYFYLPNRQETRGVGGIFYDNLNSGNFAQDFAFTKQVGLAFLQIFPKIVRRHIYRKWDQNEKDAQLVKRGRYVEFNLLYDRGTKFGLMTNGNTEAILMSLPPMAKWI